jgi:hypothetical protein
MIIQIHDSLPVSQVQERFSKCFPFLKIEFYTRPLGPGEASSENYLIHHSRKIGEIRDEANEGCLEIKSWFTAGHVEKDFRDLFGLNVQVFRKENDDWIQTTRTDCYSLYEQNEMSCLAEHSIFRKYKEQLVEYGYL